MFFAHICLFRYYRQCSLEVRRLVQAALSYAQHRSSEALSGGISIRGQGAQVGALDGSQQRP